MKTYTKRFNYLSHLIDAAVAGVVRLAWTAAVISLLMTMVVVVNTAVFWRVEIDFRTAGLLAAGLELGLFWLVFFIQAHWVAYMVHADVEQILSQTQELPDNPLPQKEVKRVYMPHSTGYKLNKEITEWGGAAEKLPK